MKLPHRGIRSRVDRIARTVEARDRTRREVEAVEIMYQLTDKELSDRIADLEQEAGDPALDVRELESELGHPMNADLLRSLEADEPDVVAELRRRRNARRSDGLPCGPGCSVTPPPGGIRPLKYTRGRLRGNEGNR